MYTHIGRPSNDLSSLVKMSISSFIIVSFKLLIIPLCVSGLEHAPDMVAALVSVCPGEACRAVSGIDVSVKPVRLRL
jgi:hypothetical protein